MNATARSRTPRVTAARAGLSEATIALAIEAGHFRLADGRPARQAPSCLLGPEPGDRVLTWCGDDGVVFVLAVLARPAPGEAVLAVPGARRVTVAAPRLSIEAGDRLSLSAASEVEVAAPGGLLSLGARSLQVTVVEDVIHTARHVITQCEHWLQEARGLLRLHSRQAVVTAEEDVRIDGQRISMG